MQTANTASNVNVMQQYNDNLYIEDIQCSDCYLTVTFAATNTTEYVTNKMIAQLQTQKFAAYIMQVCKNNNINILLTPGQVDDCAVYFQL